MTMDTRALTNLITSALAAAVAVFGTSYAAGGSTKQSLSAAFSGMIAAVVQHLRKPPQA